MLNFNYPDNREYPRMTLFIKCVKQAIKVEWKRESGKIQELSCKNRAKQCPYLSSVCSLFMQPNLVINDHLI